MSRTLIGLPHKDIHICKKLARTYLAFIFELYNYHVTKHQYIISIVSKSKSFLAMNLLRHLEKKIHKLHQVSSIYLKILFYYSQGHEHIARLSQSIKKNTQGFPI